LTLGFNVIYFLIIDKVAKCRMSTQMSPSLMREQMMLRTNQTNASATFVSKKNKT